ncbi:hypothetical protein [Rhizobium sp. ZPR3]|uniref:Uncharacterized protein n=2 Tax=unclassified Rhizobium TaxID=2613769 RepID=A0AAU7SEH5_9HYPH
MKHEDDETEVGAPIAPRVKDRKDETRRPIAIWLTIAIIAFAFVGLLGVIFLPDRAPAIKDQTATTLAMLVGIYGTVLGFYFGKTK